jgi:hypothetical protein
MEAAASERRITEQLAVVAARVSAVQQDLKAGRPALKILAEIADLERQLEQVSSNVASRFANELAEALPPATLQRELAQTFALLRRHPAVPSVGSRSC